MARKTNNYNGYESSLTGPLTIGATSVAVESALGLIAPLYLIVDPDIPAKREWVRVNTITTNTLENIVRNLGGSVGDIEHDAGAKIRSVPTHQIFDDIFQDAIDDELALTLHQTDGGDPHESAGYLTEGTADVVYVRLSGSNTTALAPMSGFLFLFGDPTEPLHAAPMQYVDAQDVATQAAAEANAQAYADATFLPLAGGTMAGVLDMGNQDITNASIIHGRTDGPLILRRALGQEMIIDDPSGTDRVVFQTDGVISFNWPDGSPALRYDPAGFLGIWDFFTGEVNINGLLSKVDDPFGPLDAANKQWVEANFAPK